MLTGHAKEMTFVVKLGRRVRRDPKPSIEVLAILFGDKTAGQGAASSV